VLLSVQHNAWQLTDFGLTQEGVSGVAIRTRMSRGSEGYRGPELVIERSVVCQQSDMFALGCVLHELVTGKQLFPRDYYVFNFMFNKQLPNRPQLEIDKRSIAYINELRNAMLDVMWENRPSARDVMKELGGAKDNWRESIAMRSRDLRYLDETSQDWELMRWKPFW
jgi:eukaryotic-like serine/threonine-protein kinase